MTDQPADNASHSSPSTGIVVAVALLLVSGAGYRSLAAWYDRSPDSVAIPAGTLDGLLSLTLGDWTGHNEEVDEYVLRKTGTDDHVNRVYERQWGRESVSLWIAYGVRPRDLMPHRPEVCYSGAGWTLESDQPLELASGDEGVLPCRLMTFKRGVLATERITVLNYYIVDGERSAGVSQLRSKAARGGGSASYAAQIQIVATTVRRHEEGARKVRAFASESAAAIATMLSDAVASVSSSGSEDL